MPPPPDEIVLRKWYFACNRNALLHAFDQIAIAVTSATRNTRLRPICLVDSRHDLADVADRLAWLERAGVHLIRHEAAFFSIILQHFGPAAEVFSGHWLRCDIPLLEKEDEFVLYTDIDVMFRRDVSLSPIRPRMIACAPEFEQTVFDYFNSGVMIMNIAALRQTRRALLRVLKAHLPFMTPHDDQRILNAAYRDDWARLPNSWNWKPYWGFSDEAAIVHFHGPKPAMARRMLAGDAAGFAPDYTDLFARDPGAYAQYLDETTAFSPPSIESRGMV